MLTVLPRKRGTFAVLVLVWAAWLALPYFGLGPESYVRIHDNADGTLAAKVPLRTTTPSSLKTAWDPQPVSGLDQVPMTSSAELDSWLFAFLPGWLAYGLVMFAQRFIAGYFTFRLLKDRLGQGLLASVCGGLVYAAFAQSTINASWAGFTLYDGLALAGLPLLLWALDGHAGWSYRRRLIVAVALGFLLGITSLYFSAVFVVFAVVVWMLARRRTSVRHALLAIGLFLLGWVVAEVPAVWGSLVNASLSQRADWALNTVPLGDAISRQYSYVRGILLDNQVLVAAALLGLAATRLRNRALLVALAASASIFLLVLASVFWLTGLRRYAGPLGGFQVDRIYLLAPFALIVAGSMGLDVLAVKLRGRLPADAGRRGRVWAASLTLLVILVLGPLASARVDLRILREMRAGSTYAAVYQSPELERLAAGTRALVPYRVATVYAPQVFAPVPDSMWPWLVGPLPAFAWAYGLETVDGYVNMYPKRYQRFWGRVTAPALERDKAMSDYFWYWGNRVYMFIPDTGGPPPAVTNLADLCDPDLLSLANVRYLISPVRLGGYGLTLVAGDGHGKPWPVYIYENTRVLPRYFLAQSTRTLPDSSAVLVAMGNASLDELSSVAFVEAGYSDDLRPRAPRPGGRVRLLNREADLVSLSATARAPSFLVCSMSYSPYWRAYVDGHETEVVPTDSTLMGVGIPEGTHRVELRYEPPYAWLFPG